MYSEPIVTHALQHCILMPIPMPMYALSQVEGFLDILTQLGVHIRRDGSYQPLLVCVFPKGAFTGYLHSSFGHTHAPTTIPQLDAQGDSSPSQILETWSLEISTMILQ
jgi:hypothetical protein